MDKEIIVVLDPAIGNLIFFNNTKHLVSKEDFPFYIYSLAEKYNINNIHFLKTNEKYIESFKEDLCKYNKYDYGFSNIELNIIED